MHLYHCATGINFKWGVGGGGGALGQIEDFGNIEKDSLKKWLSKKKAIKALDLTYTSYF